MFCIVLHHFAYHGSMSWATTYNKAFLKTDQIYLFLACLGKAAVIAFVMTGAWFLSKKQFKLWRVINLCITTFVYSWLIFIVLRWKFPGLINGVKNNIWLPIPIPSNYWFVIAYCYMLLFMPFLNIILNKLSRRQVICLIFLFSVLWTIIQFIPNQKLDNNDYNFFNLNNYFLLIYLIAGYLRKYTPSWATSFIKSTFMLVCVLVIILLAILSISKNSYNVFAGLMASLNNPFSLCLGISIFLFFNNMSLGHSRIINYISKSMFGVYLIHDNSFIRPVIWQKLVKTITLSKYPFKYLEYGLIVSLYIFVICTFIDILKRIAIDPVINFFAIKVTRGFLKWSLK